MSPEPTDPSRQDRYRTEQIGCGILLLLLAGVLLLPLVAGVFWGGPWFWLNIIREERHR